MFKKFEYLVHITKKLENIQSDSYLLTKEAFFVTVCVRASYLWAKFMDKMWAVSKT